MTDFENYKNILDSCGATYDIWREDTTEMVDVETEFGCFTICFDKYTGIALYIRTYPNIFQE